MAHLGRALNGPEETEGLDVNRREARWAWSCLLWCSLRPLEVPGQLGAHTHSQPLDQHAILPI